MVKRDMKKLLFTFFAVLSAWVTYAQTDIKVEVHRVVEVGEQFNVTFIIEGENFAKKNRPPSFLSGLNLVSCGEQVF